jgi:hypothetical protein
VHQRLEELHEHGGLEPGKLSPRVSMSTPDSTSEETTIFPNQRWNVVLAATFTLMGIYYILSSEMGAESSTVGVPFLLLGVFGFYRLLCETRPSLASIETGHEPSCWQVLHAGNLH